jgi:glycosyltransferase involved in cell wall biosynthesis
MKALLLTPTYFPQLTGNAVTVHRITKGLLQRGIACRIINLSQTADVDLMNEADAFAPDIIHGFHAYKTGLAGVRLKKIFGVPLVITMTGTDINVDLRDRDRKTTVRDVLYASDLVTVFNDHAFSVLLKYGLPEDKIRIIHQSVLLDDDKNTLDYRALYGVDRQDRLFLMSGGLRRIKQIGYAIDVLTEVRKIRPHLRLFIAGSILEPEEYRKIEGRLRRRPWITYLGEVRRENMPALLRSVDVVLNTSASESEANALLEAFYFRKIVIARSIPGNASLLTDKTSFLFRNKREFYEKILYVIDHPTAWEPVRREADRLMTTVFSFQREQVGYTDAYEALVGASG